VSIGALGDSFYEYLLKAFIQTDGKDVEALEMYKEALKVTAHSAATTAVKITLLRY